MALFCASQMSLSATAWPTSVSWMPQAPIPLFLRTTSLTCFLYIFVSFLREHVCTYVIYHEDLRLPAILSHFMCTAPFSMGYISRAEANLVSTHILKVHSFWFSFCWMLKWAIIVHAIETSMASPNFPCPYELLPSWCIHFEVPQILAFLCREWYMHFI